ncbi:MAG: ComEC/Rec2 family competence protein [Bdellovibrionales bacterium]|nr:ComEC/Rec2 family competence protein [Bdellovibrionales bacterium]
MANPISYAHKICLSFSPPSSAYRELYSAIVCGADPELNDFGMDMRTIGLYHLMVVSGSHLIFLEQLLNHVTTRLGRSGQLIIFITLTFFAFCCSLLPPVTRALISFMLRKCSLEQKLFWKGHHIALLAGLFTLMVFPEWIKSLSFIMSWIASLLVSLPIQSELKKHFAVYLGLIPIFIGLQPQHPLTALVNWLLGPILGVVLFPASLLSFLISPLSYIVDPIWGGTLVLSHALAEYFKLPGSSFHIPLLAMWIYLLSLHILIYNFLVTRNRALA